SAASSTGLDSFDFRLSIDTDGSAAQNFETFDLVKDATLEAHPFNNSDSQFDWVHSSNPSFAIQDDGGDAGGHVTQNIQKLQWYNGGEELEAGDQYQVKLEAFNNGTVIAETEITIEIDGRTERFLEDFNDGSANDLFF